MKIIQNKNRVELVRGDSSLVRIVLQRQNEDKTVSPLNLNDYPHIEFTARVKCVSVLNLTIGNGIIVPNAENGEIYLDVKPSHTESATWRLANFDLQLTDKFKRVKTIMFGVLSLRHDCTL